jgi:hypothetical protein
MKLTRRVMLKSALISAAAATHAGRSFAAGSGAAPLAWRVFDSRRHASRAWLGSDAGRTIDAGRTMDAGRAIDVAHDAANRWVRLRGLNPEGRVAGLTTWSDFVQVRGLLQEKGKRLRVESRSGDLFYWEMG